MSSPTGCCIGSENPNLIALPLSPSRDPAGGLPLVSGCLTGRPMAGWRSGRRHAQRAGIEREREKAALEREHRTREWMENTNRLFRELSEKSVITADEKEKRIKELMESTKRFFQEQKESSEKFMIMSMQRWPLIFLNQLRIFNK